MWTLINVTLILARRRRIRGCARSEIQTGKLGPARASGNGPRSTQTPPQNTLGCTCNIMNFINPMFVDPFFSRGRPGGARARIFPARVGPCPNLYEIPPNPLIVIDLINNQSGIHVHFHVDSTAVGSADFFGRSPACVSPALSMAASMRPYEKAKADSKRRLPAGSHPKPRPSTRPQAPIHNVKIHSI